MLLKVQTELVGDVTALRFSGEIRDGGVSDIALRDAIDVTLKTGAKNLLLDLTDISKFEADCVGVLVGGYRKACAGKVAMKLLMSPSGQVVDYFRAVKLDTFFTIFTDEADAIASFSDTGGANA